MALVLAVASCSLAPGVPLRRHCSRCAPPTAQHLLGVGDDAAAAPGLLFGADGSVLGADSASDDEKPKGPRFDLGAASSRPDEVVFGAAATDSADALPEWCAHMRGEGMGRALALLSFGDVFVCSPDGTPEGYSAALQQAGFSHAAVIDPSEPGACAAVEQAAREARAAGEKLLVHCIDGHAATSLALAGWLLLDYIGGDNVQEACDWLTASKRKTRVERRPEPAALAAFVGVEYETPVEFEENWTGPTEQLAPDGAPPDEVLAAKSKGDAPTRLASGLYIG